MKTIVFGTSSEAHNIWMIRELQEDGSRNTVGKLLMHVDDALAMFTTKTVGRLLLGIKEQWNLSINGILVRDERFQSSKSAPFGFWDVL